MKSKLEKCPRPHHLLLPGEKCACCNQQIPSASLDELKSAIVGLHMEISLLQKAGETAAKISAPEVDKLTVTVEEATRILQDALQELGGG